MKKQADYIKRIEIKRLWGRKDISWELRPDVNILSGVNGIGRILHVFNSADGLSYRVQLRLSTDFARSVLCVPCCLLFTFLLLHYCFAITF